MYLPICILLFHFSSEEFTVRITQRTKLMRETYLGESQTKLNDADSFRVNVAATQVKITTISRVLGRNRNTTTILKYRRCKIASHFRSIKTLPKLGILFSSNHNIHKSSYSLCFWASDPLIDRFY